jgi:hypothetical protein
MEPILKFLKGVLRVSLISALTLLLVGFAVWRFFQWRGEQEAAELGKLVQHQASIQAHTSFGSLVATVGTARKKEYAPVPVDIRMTWRDGRIFVQFTLRATSGNASSLIFRFKDSNSFEVSRETVAASKLVNIYDKNGGISERQGEFSHYLSADEYRRVADVDVLFTGEWMRTDPDEGYYYDANGAHLKTLLIKR